MLVGPVDPDNPQPIPTTQIINNNDLPVVVVVAAAVEVIVAQVPVLVAPLVVGPGVIVGPVHPDMKISTHSHTPDN